VHVNEEGAARDDVRLTLAARQQLSLRLLRHGTHGPNGSNRRGPCQDTTHSGYSSRTRLAAKGKRAGSLMRQNPDSDWLKLKLAHRADLSDPISSIQQQSRKLRC
jgi:hypothetical protein